MRTLRYAFSDTLVLAKRSVLRIRRQPDLLVGFAVQPVMFVLLFVYVFGGAIRTPGFKYVDFLMPGIIVQTMAFGGFVTAARVMAVLMTLFACSLLGWIIRRLMSSSIRQEFA